MVDAGRVLFGGQDRVGLGGGVVGVGGRVGADRLLVLVGRGGGRRGLAVAIGVAEDWRELVDVLEVHGHGDRVGVGFVGDLDHDNAAVVAAADLILVVGGGVEGEDAARGHGEEGLVGAAADRVGLGGGAVGVGGRVGPDRLLVLVGRGGGRVPVAELGRDSLTSWMVMVIVWATALAPVSVAVTTTTYSLLVPASPGDS